MGKDIKILIGAIVLTLVIIAGLAFLASKNSQSQTKLGLVEGVTANPGFYDLGAVPINGGVVEKEYEVVNTTGSKIVLKKIVTSCMCTQAAFKMGENQTKFFGMEGHGDANAPVNVEIPSGETGKVITRFDPAAHGPQGTGPFDRVIYLTFSDPAGIKDLKFSGTVVPK